MGVVIPKADCLSPLFDSPYMPEFSPFIILHAEQKLTLVKSKLEIGVEYEHEGEVVDIQDKGKNAFMLFRINSFCKN